MLINTQWMHWKTHHRLLSTHGTHRLLPCIWMITHYLQLNVLIQTMKGNNVSSFSLSSSEHNPKHLQTPIASWCSQTRALVLILENSMRSRTITSKMINNGEWDSKGIRWAVKLNMTTPYAQMGRIWILNWRTKTTAWPYACIKQQPVVNICKK